MKRFLFFLLSFLHIALFAAAETDSLAPISIDVYGKYGYNPTWKSFGEVAVSGHFPLHRHFSLRAGVNLKTANVYAVDGRATAHFPLKVGELSLENRLLYTAAIRTSHHEFCEALTLGYRMDFFAVQLGGMLRLLLPMNEPKTQLVEPTFVYSIEGNVRRQSDFWNIGLRISNFDDFQIERASRMIFTLMSRYDFNNNWRIFADVYTKPAGMFHIAAQFYEAGARVGFRYSFNQKSPSL